ncbi:MAG: DUF3604 domain-containing protein [Polyangiaceae bacterium]
MNRRSLFRPLAVKNGGASLGALGLLGCVLLSVPTACGSNPEVTQGSGGSGGAAGYKCDLPEAKPSSYVESREPCADHNPLRNAYFGDLHVHTRLSFDAYADQTRVGPREAYRFAKGDAISVAPLDANGQGTQTLQLKRPLDFVAVTDHAEFLGEVLACITPGATGYDSEFCQNYRIGGPSAVQQIALPLSAPEPKRREDLCGADGNGCESLARDGWQTLIDAAEEAYDKTSSCSFSALIGYEWTGATGVSNLHRNVIFKNDRVLDYPVTYMETPKAQELWARLECECRRAIDGCEVLAIPHNSNLSNGKMFIPEYPGATSIEEERDQAKLRGAMEPLVEVFQHKGSSECSYAQSSNYGEVDEQCQFEQFREGMDCGETTGALGMINGGCVSRYDFVRGALLAGLSEEARLGTNPLRLGMISSTDTHLGAPGAVDEDQFLGHTGGETKLEDRLQKIIQPPSGVISTPGGLVGVWSTENSRSAIFEALARRETFGTSGPRITPRFFGGFGLDMAACGKADWVATADAQGVPMGATLDASMNPQGSAPSFIVSVDADPDSSAAPLERVQIVKGWVDADGKSHVAVYDVAGQAGRGTLNLDTCETGGEGDSNLCAAWVDPSFDPGVRAYYYVRALENPTCRWSWRQCLSLPEVERPEACSDPSVAKQIQERAWSSPIWYEPGAG